MKNGSRTRSRFAIFLAAAALFSSLDAERAGAQQASSAEPSGPSGPARWEFGFSLLRAQPVGEFAQHVGTGGGFGLLGLRNLGGDESFGLRIDLTLVSYGRTSESHSILLTGTRVDVDVTTENTIATLAVGPHLSLGHGAVRPYFGASIGSANFVTTTAIWSEGRPVPIATTEVQGRNALALSGGGGVRLRFRDWARRPISIELDGRYRRHGRVEYLREGGVRERPDGSVELERIVSAANLWTFHVGAVVGIR